MTASMKAAYRRNRALDLREMGHESCARRYEMIAEYFEQPFWRRVAAWPRVWWRNYTWPNRKREGGGPWLG